MPLQAVKLPISHNNVVGENTVLPLNILETGGAVPVECLFTLPLILLVNFGVSLLYLLGIGW